MSLSNKDYLIVFLWNDVHNFVFYFNSWKNCCACVTNEFIKLKIWLVLNIQLNRLTQNRFVFNNGLIPFHCELWIVYDCHVFTVKVRDAQWRWIISKLRVARWSHVFLTLSKFCVAWEVEDHFLVAKVLLWNIF